MTTALLFMASVTIGMIVGLGLVFGAAVVVIMMLQHYGINLISNRLQDAGRESIKPPPPGEEEMEPGQNLAGLDERIIRS